MIRGLIMARSAGPFAAACMLGALVLLGAYAYGRAGGKAACRAHYVAELAKRDLREAQAVAEQVEAMRAQIDMAAAIERRHLEEQLRREQERKQQIRHVREYVQARPNLADCTIDAAGIKLWDTANKGGGAPRRAAATGKRARGAVAAMSPPAPAAGRQAAKPHQ